MDCAVRELKDATEEAGIELKTRNEICNIGLELRDSRDRSPRHHRQWRNQLARSELISKRFSELVEQASSVEATKKRGRYDHNSDDIYVDSAALTNWAVKARHLLSMACGSNSEHYAQFCASEKGSHYQTNHDKFLLMRSVLLAAKEDYDGGYFTNLRSLVQAEVFDNELDQASELLEKGYHTAAAVVAGVVLETTLKQLCHTHGIALDKANSKLDRMNAELAKAGVYNLLQQKRITALADLRNNAAHGNPDQYSSADVNSMIRDVEAFLAKYI